MHHAMTFTNLPMRRLGTAGCAFALFAVGACSDEAIVYPNRNLQPPTSGATSTGDAGEGGALPSGGTSAGGNGGLIGSGTGGILISLGGEGLIDEGDAGSSGAAPADQCGDGVVQAPEECDDHNTVSGDGCSAQCKSSCETCEKNVCPNWSTSGVADWYANCYKLAGNAVTGAAAGVPRAQLCAAALDCARAENCVRLAKGFADIRSCWCDVDWGSSQATTQCKADPSDNPANPSTFVKGKCYQEFTDASEKTTSFGILTSLTAFGNAFGASYGLFMGCDRRLCAEECLPGFYPTERVATIAADLTSTPNAAGESQLGDLMVDAFRAAAKSDFAFAASQTIALDGDNLWFKATPNRAADADGRVLRSEALAVVIGYQGAQPQNQALYAAGSLVTATYTGQQIYDALGEQFNAQSSRLFVSGLKYTWSGVVGQSPQPTIVEVRTNDGILLDKAKTYTLATTTTMTATTTTTFPTLPKGTNLSTVANGEASAVWLAYLPTLPQPIAAPSLDRITLQASP